MTLSQNMAIFIRYHWCKVVLHVLIVSSLLTIGVLLNLYGSFIKDIDVKWTPSMCQYVGYNFTLKTSNGSLCDSAFSSLPGSIGNNTGHRCRTYAHIMSIPFNTSICSDIKLPSVESYYCSSDDINTTECEDTIKKQFPTGLVVNCDIDNDCSLFSINHNYDRYGDSYSQLGLFGYVFGILFIIAAIIFCIVFAFFFIRRFRQAQISGILDRLSSDAQNNYVLTM